jgi:endonuclease/exonuclease/phosphatase (EEP) superfamily protein YafD
MKKNFLIKLFWALFNLLTFGFIIASLAGFLGRMWWVFDLASHFRVQYLVVLVILGLVFGTGRRLLPACIAGIFFIMNLVLIAPLHFNGPMVNSLEESYRILFANAHTSNPQHHLIRNWIIEADPDIVALLEVDRMWLDDLNLDELGYLYSLEEARGDNFGIALYSRYPIFYSEFLYFGGLELPSIFANVMLNGSPVAFVVAHPMPPRNEHLTLYRNQQMSDLASFVAELKGSVIVAGDLNTTSWSPFFREWLEVSQLQDSRRGFGVQPTWPTYNWLLSVPIDHILITPDVQVHHRQVGPAIGSDHYPILMDFSIADDSGEN